MNFEQFTRRIEKLERDAPPRSKKPLRFAYESDEAKRRRLMELIAQPSPVGDGRPNPELAHMTDADLLEVIGATAEEFDAAARAYGERLYREGRIRLA